MPFTPLDPGTARTAMDGDIDYGRFSSKLRSRLQELRAAIHAALLRADAESYGEIAGHVHDAEEESLADLLTDVNLAEISREVTEIRDTDAALRRIAGRTYGVCVSCGEPIERGRLEVWPSAKRCLDCQRAYEAHAPQPAPTL